MNTIVISKLNDKSNRTAENYSLVDPAVQSYIAWLRGAAKIGRSPLHVYLNTWSRRVTSYIHKQVKIY